MQINVLEYFERGALAGRRHKVAVIDQGQEMTFDSLARSAKNCAALILERTAALNRPIAVFLPKSASTIVADLGILYAGNCYANLDLKAPPERLKATLKNLGPELILTSAAHAATLRAAGALEHQLLFIEAALRPDAAHDESLLRVRLERVIDTDPLCIIHTSGSTGTPKGVVLSHRGTIDFMDWAFSRFDFDGGEIIGSLSPFHFDIYTLELYLCLAKGATLVIIPEQSAAFPATLLEFVAAHSVNFVFWVPTIMVNIANQDLLAKRPPEGLRRIFFAGEVFPTKYLNYWRRNLPRAQFVNLYGPIEISVDCTYFVVDRDMADDEKLPIGHPCRNSDILILNEQDRPAEPDELGELCVRGSSLSMGYWNNPERTSQAFVQNPLNPHYPELIYRTGDIVHRNQRGEIMIVGRKDFQIKHLGYRIDLGEIEHAALQVGGIGNACVTYNQNKKEITLYFESAEDKPAAHIRERLAAYLPKYMLPTVFRRVDQLPRNPNGKIDRHLLAARGAADGAAAAP
jgi:D-alanine--poly(phosphoribitol) ligase subunit 1